MCSKEVLTYNFIKNILVKFRWQKLCCQMSPRWQNRNLLILVVNNLIIMCLDVFCFVLILLGFAELLESMG